MIEGTYFGSAVEDCAGVCGGDAVLSGCDMACGYTATLDECGVCDSAYGLNDSGCCGDDLSDCNGTCFDSSLLGWATDGCDSSGYLPGYTTPGYGLNFLCEEYNYDDGMCDIYQDCAGAYFGSAVVDCAGTCGGSAVEDYCGVCNGTNVVMDVKKHQTLVLLLEVY